MTTCKLCEYLAGLDDECAFTYEDLCSECAEIVTLIEEEEEDDIPA